jgi:hypothetical protein
MARVTAPSDAKAQDNDRLCGGQADSGIVVLPFEVMVCCAVQRAAFLRSCSCWRCRARSRLTAAASRVRALPAEVTLPIPVAGSALPAVSTGSSQVGCPPRARWADQPHEPAADQDVPGVVGCPHEFVAALGDDGVGDSRDGRPPLGCGWQPGIPASARDGVACVAGIQRRRARARPRIALVRRHSRPCEGTVLPGLRGLLPRLCRWRVIW